ncbi:hypothetical protein OMP38_00200 [Cohnella ginsengisoli]|uniref:Uncharacterized protein n=1 Tax=Cohnella ginsengisoli TaxID=425004 RepID=A0A9X4KCP6_9BACL|nr:hypothetical protein [Cohnella ginsengisoli]MDG0789445.1 hypothetical protein [Cohnella ginsengisoli]
MNNKRLAFFFVNWRVYRPFMRLDIGFGQRIRSALIFALSKLRVASLCF